MESNNSGYARVLDRLSTTSASSGIACYGGAPWDAPHLDIEKNRDSWQLPTTHPIGSTRWYQSRSVETQIEIGQYVSASSAKLGIALECELQQGLLAWARRLPNGVREFRYVHHVVAEETQHSLMFQEVINRLGVEPAPIPEEIVVPGIAADYGRRDECLLVLYAMAFEDPSDRLQRNELRRGGLHPLAERVYRTHVTEEGRHRSFGRSFLAHRVPQLSPAGQRRLRQLAPFAIGQMMRSLLGVPAGFAERFSAPVDILAEVPRCDAFRSAVHDATRGFVRLCAELGLIEDRYRHVWAAAGVAA